VDRSADGRMYEAVEAARQHRERYDLHHAALEVHLGGDRYVIESAPAWDRVEPDRGVVVVGPVGLPWLGRSKWFRYEVRRWRDGIIPDVAYAVDSPRRVSAERGRAPGWSAGVAVGTTASGRLPGYVA